MNTKRTGRKHTIQEIKSTVFIVYNTVPGGNCSLFVTTNNTVS